jgi:hypothetical protein
MTKNILLGGEAAAGAAAFESPPSSFFSPGGLESPPFGSK